MGFQVEVSASKASATKQNKNRKLSKSSFSFEKEEKKQLYRIKIYSIDLNTMILSEYLLAKGTNWDRKAIIKSLPIEAINRH